MEAVHYLLLLAAAGVASELLLRLPLMEQAKQLLTVTRKSASTLRSNRISDHWKETVLPAYSIRMAGRSILFFILLCVVALPVALMGLVAPGGFGRWLDMLMQPLPMLLLCGASLAYILARVKLIRG